MNLKPKNIHFFLLLITINFYCDQKASDLYEPTLGLPIIKNFPGLLNSACISSDSSIVICGAKADNLIIKINKDDTQIWQKELYLPFNCKLTSIVNAENDNLIICGNVSNNWVNFKNDILVLKINKFGDTLFTKIMRDSSDTYSIKLIKTNDNNFIILGRTSKIINNKESSDICIYKIDQFGQIIWYNEFSFSDSEFPNDILQTNNGDIIITCDQFDKLGNKFLFILRTNPNGKLLWHKKPLNKSYLSGNMCIETSQGNFVVCGQSNDKLEIYQFDAVGQEIWNTAFGIHKEIVSGNNIIKDEDHGFLILGTSFNIKTFDSDILLIKFSKLGNLIWSRKILGTDSDYGKYIFKDRYGDNIVIGNTFSPELFSPGNNTFLFRTDRNGVFK